MILPTGTVETARWVRRSPTGTWADNAGCKGMDPNIFFPVDVDGEKRAISICMECQVRSDCLDHAIEQDEGDGVWGGTTANEREKIIDKRKGAEHHKALVAREAAQRRGRARRKAAEERSKA